MSKKTLSVLFGLIVIAIGVGYGAAALGYIDHFTIFIKGWWTIFLILPGLIGLFKSDSHKFLPLCLIALGVVLFLQQQDIITASIKNLILPAVIIIFGVSVIINALVGHRVYTGGSRTTTTISVDGSDVPVYETSFGEVNPDYAGRVFEGCHMDVTFGSGKLDLRNAVIDRDVAISINTAFSGVKIQLPPGCRVDVQTSTSFGGVSNKYVSSELPGSPLVSVHAAVSFGGVEIQ